MREGCSEETEVQWERFLPRTELRVLLVEADDSTRQIISALLRKCSYKVSAVPDGLKAWHILKGKHHNIDLVLTEMELPSISGFALLSLVMEHDDCKSIPIIMMSSHDSISMVLKCMLKGAADFLIKPVRKNELRNLWHHVWRRHTLAGGHIPPNLTAAQQKLETGIDNNTASNHSSDYVISSNKDKDSREEGSDAQGLSQPKCKTTSSLSNSGMEKQEESAKLPRKSVIQESETDENPSKFESDVAGPSNDPYKTSALRLEEDHDCAKALTRYESLGSESPGNGNITSEGSGNRREAGESLGGAIDFIGTFDNHPICRHVLSGSIDGGSNKFECITQLELSLRRICPSSFNDEKTDKRHALSSSASAISRHNNSKTLHSFFPTLAGTCTELEESSDKIRDLFFSHHSENTVGTSQNSPTLGNNEENTTSVIDVHSGQENIAFPRPIAGLRYGDLCEGYSPSVFYAKSDIGSTWSPKPDCQEEKTKMSKLKQDYERSNESLNNCDDQVANEEAVEELRQSSSSSLCNGIATQASSNVNGSGSDGVAAVENLNDGLRSVRWSEREAALTKFRLKRKDRCYEKKVRYQSRKRLAEQRPRVKGQFVRQLQTTIAVVVTATATAADN